MKKYTKLMAFAAVLTMLTYTGCGASPEMNSVSSVAPAEFAGDAPRGEAKGEIAAEAPAAVPEAAGDAAAVREAGDDAVAGDVINSAEFSAIADGAKEALSAVKTAGSSAEMNADEIAPEAYGDDAVIDPVVPEPVPEPEPETLPAIGMLTAGEWKDHENWGFFSNLVNTGVIEFPSFGIDPTQRIAVTVTDADGTPLPNVQVVLNHDSQAVWRAVTDKNGQAYVFEMNGKTGTNLTVTQGELSQTIEIEAAPTDEQGNAADRNYTVQLGSEQKLYHNTQIMFIVDTTGSMGDEMLYLQSDFSAIAEEAGNENTTYSVNFYKDEGDSYVTNCSGFTGDVQAIKSKLNAEFASGGGDEPEAVYEVMKETMFSPDWKEEAVKIAFLIYDAPPHAGTDFEAVIEEASAKGIHLVPVVSSNGSRETELFGRAAAICTNGDYVFLTDDSGIGDSHLEPIIGDYEVESLHDIIVRIIQNYQQ